MILVDRSRYERRMQHCHAAAYLAYDYGGVGLRAAGEAMPLATGGAVHKPLQVVLEYARDNAGAIIPRPLLKKAIDETIGKYKKRVLARGFDGEASEQGQFIANEQATLIEGLVWAAYRVFIPWLLGEFKILDVEREETYVVGCSCGVGDGLGEVQIAADRSDALHEGNGCEGIVVMSRPDFLAERKSDGIVGVWDFKTNSYEPRQEEHRLQFAFGTMGAERRLGREISHYYICSLLKGKRDFQSKDEKENGGVKKQASALCYAYYKDADPPFEQGDWSWEYTRAKGFAKVPTWISPVIQNAGGVEGMVMDLMPATFVEGLVHVSPPMQRPTRLIRMILQEIAAEEREWEWKKGQVTGPADPNFPLFIRRSWDCDDYYGRPCEFSGICDGHPGWETPQKLQQWVARGGNHELEKEMMKNKGEGLTEAGWVVREEEE